MNGNAKFSTRVVSFNLINKFWSGFKKEIFGMNVIH